MHAHGFDITQDEHLGRVTLRITGELDIATAPRLRSAVETAWSSGAGEIVLDMRSVRFIDSSGLREILRTREACEERATGMSALSELQPGPRKLFEITGAGDVLRWREPDEPRGAAGERA